MSGSDNSRGGDRHGTGSPHGGRPSDGPRGAVPRGDRGERGRQPGRGGQPQRSGRRRDTGDSPRRRDRRGDGDQRRPRQDDRASGGKRGQRAEGAHGVPRDRAEDRRDGRSGRGSPRRASADYQPGEQKPGGQPKTDEPRLPEDTDPAELDATVRKDLRAIPKGLADKIAAHLVAAGNLIDDDPRQALRHARYARQRASRVAAVREANGITAYQAGEWSEALGELRAARRMGGPGHLALMADCERALGRPERALDIARSPEAAELDEYEAVELRIVTAGARRDMGELDASVVSLQIPELDPRRQDPWSARLFYAYADNLLAAGRPREAFRWFVHAAHADDESETDAPQRLDELLVLLGDAADELVTEQVCDTEKPPGEDDESERDNRD